MCKRTGQYRMYEEMGIYQLLFSIRDNNILERIVEEQVGILIAYDQEDDSEMDHLFLHENNRVFVYCGQRDMKIFRIYGYW